MVARRRKNRSAAPRPIVVRSVARAHRPGAADWGVAAPPSR